MACAAIFGATVFGAPALAAPAKTQEEREKAIDALQPQTGGSAKLPQSSATLAIAPRHAAYIGPDAVTFSENFNGVTEQAGNLEAIFVRAQTEALVAYRSTREGYVKFDDWGDVDADQMLTDVREGTEEANKEREAIGVKPVHVVGWRERPTLDRDQKLVHWQIEGESEGYHSVNAVVLVFGRYGYEKLTWVGNAKDDPSSLLNEARAAFAFDTGATYDDFKPGDKVAEYGIAALIATAVGAKIAAKLGLLAVALVFLKKAWFVLLVIPAMLWRWIKGRFARGPST